MLPGLRPRRLAVERCETPALHRAHEKSRPRAAFSCAEARSLLGARSGRGGSGGSGSSSAGGSSGGARGGVGGGRSGRSGSRGRSGGRGGRGRSGRRGFGLATSGQRGSGNQRGQNERLLHFSFPLGYEGGQRFPESGPGGLPPPVTEKESLERLPAQPTIIARLCPPLREYPDGKTQPAERSTLPARPWHRGRSDQSPSVDAGNAGDAFCSHSCSSSCRATRRSGSAPQ